MFNRLCIVGIGLIGGSFGLAIKKHGLAREVVGVARRESTLKSAVELGACDFATANLVEAATGADFVFLSPPVGQMKATCEAIADVVAPGALITDAGSTKARIVAECEPIFQGRARFLGSHPMAGSEKTGVEAARADLFDGAVWITTPTEGTDLETIEEIESVVKTFGARTLRLTPEKHDELLAVTSHLPHFTASALMHSFLKAKSGCSMAPEVVAGGWRDGTRVAAGSPEMWRDIALANGPAIMRAIDEFSDELSRLREAISDGDGDTIYDWLDAAARERRSL